MPYIYRYAGRNKWVFINPAFHEPFGLTIVEAMASGLPVITSDCGGVPFAVKDAAVLVPQNDVEFLAREKT